MDLLKVARQQKAILVCGHVPVSRYGKLIGLPMTCTLLREPVARVISHYRHASRLQGFEGDLLRFARADHHRNLQARVLDRLDPGLLGMVGLTERYRESIDLLNRLWGWKLPHRVDNVDKQNERAALGPSAQELAELQQLNADDMQLYERATAVFENSLRYMELGISPELRGGFTPVCAGNAISGWCCAMVGDEVPVVELTLNGNPVQAVAPVSHRQDLAGWGLPRRGHIGFDIGDVEVGAGDVLALLDPATGLILDRVVVAAPA
jgi:hypothetical protein